MSSIHQCIVENDELHAEVRRLKKEISKLRRSVSFQGRVSGDMECFCWDGVPLEQRSKIVSTHEIDKEYGEKLDRLHPDSVMEYIGCRPDEYYVFTITAEPCGRVPTA